MMNETKGTNEMTLKITGERGMETKSVIVEVIRKNPNGYTVKHTDGKPAFIGGNGSEYHRMNGVRYTSLMKHCTVEVV